MILVMIGKSLRGISVTIPDVPRELYTNQFIGSSDGEGGSGAPPEH